MLRRTLEMRHMQTERGETAKKRERAATHQHVERNPNAIATTREGSFTTQVKGTSTTTYIAIENPFTTHHDRHIGPSRTSTRKNIEPLRTTPVHTDTRFVHSFY